MYKNKTGDLTKRILKGMFVIKTVNDLDSCLNGNNSLHT